MSFTTATPQKLVFKFNRCLLHAPRIRASRRRISSSTVTLSTPLFGARRFQISSRSCTPPILEALKSSQTQISPRSLSLSDCCAPCTSRFHSSLFSRSRKSSRFDQGISFRREHLSAKRQVVMRALSYPGFSASENVSRSTSELGGEKPFVVTTPLYYVNAAPHIGSAYPTMAADALARFHRLCGRQVIFITGTDEHGEKIALAAAASERADVKEFCDDVAQSYKKLWEMLDISYDRFIRTTDPDHEQVVREFYELVNSRNDIYQAKYQGLYCISCEEYKDEKELDEEKNCPVHRKPCVERDEENYFFALSKYQERLEALLRAGERGGEGKEEARGRGLAVEPEFRKNEVLNWVEEGVRDFSISRANVSWGIPVPRDENKDKKQTIYVWFDALLGYVSALLPPLSQNWKAAAAMDEKSNSQLLERAVGNGWPADVHIIGKDILRFHAVYWPGMLMSAGLSVPHKVYGHGFLTKDGLKMGKSLGNTIDPFDLVSRFGSDAVRYFFLKEIEFGKDGDFREERFANIVNANLANTIGNLLNRTLGLLKKNCGSVIPMNTNEIPEEHPLRKQCETAAAAAYNHFLNLEFHLACEQALEISTKGNLYMEETSPWAKFKSENECVREEAAQDLASVLESVRVVSLLLSPVVPRTSHKILIQLGFQEEEISLMSWSDTQWGALKKGHVVLPGQPIFQKIELEEGDDDVSGNGKGSGKSQKGPAGNKKGKQAKKGEGKGSKGAAAVVEA